MVSLFAIRWAVAWPDLSCMFTLIPITQYQDGSFIRGGGEKTQKLALGEDKREMFQSLSEISKRQYSLLLFSRKYI